MNRALPIAALGISLLVASNTYAGLGGDSSDVQVDAAALQGTVQRTPAPLYDVAEISTDSGIHVREYLSRTGRVFAVGWDGPVPPDLHLLLGSYFVSYTSALATQEHLGLRRTMRLATSELIVESGGHLRAYLGRAYLPLQVPAGVALTELR